MKHIAKLKTENRINHLAIFFSTRDACRQICATFRVHPTNKTDKLPPHRSDDKFSARETAQILIWRRDAGPSETNCTQTRRHQLGGFVELKRMCFMCVCMF
jgi:hypothetical protein